jgi:hypothetical protein
MHSSQRKKSNWTHPQVLLADDTQRSFRDADRRAYLRQIQRLVGMCLQEVFEPDDDHIMTATAGGHALGLTVGQAPDHHKNQLLLQRPCHLGERKNIRHGFGEPIDHLNLQQRDIGQEPG